MKTIYDVDYFIKKFEAIPERRWTTKVFSKVDSFIGLFEKNCAQGFCMPKKERKNSRINLGRYSFSLRQDNFPEWHALVFLFDENAHKSKYIKVGVINNGEDHRYQQPTPKQRILAALYDIKKAQQSEVKERIVYVTVDEKVRDLQNEELAVN